MVTKTVVVTARTLQIRQVQMMTVKVMTQEVPHISRRKHGFIFWRDNSIDGANN